ncbi:tigger transposable element-derived protein 4-like [Euwallacea fornicatus]|uniref:tigger transposable element-derived protein 4-like n=1 Tax=Euwallacea fornicatus TaxID=995702 RepID=UPI00338FA15D
MIVKIFKNRLNDWDKALYKTSWKNLRLIHICLANSKSLTLGNIEVVFLPPNVTATFQPMNQEIIRCLKVHYNQQFLVKSIRTADDNLLVKVAVLDSIMMLINAWRQVYYKISLMKTNCHLLNG